MTVAELRKALEDVDPEITVVVDADVAIPKTVSEAYLWSIDTGWFKPKKVKNKYQFVISTQ